jgi:predicted RNase H-like HicB family nuclease
VTPHYAINLFWSEEDGLWLADVPDLRHCTAHGDTPEDALRQVRSAVEAWIVVAREEGRSIPLPRYQPPSRAA